MGGKDALHKAVHFDQLVQDQCVGPELVCRFLAESMESYGDYKADHIVEVVVHPDNLPCYVTERSLPGGFYAIG